MQKIKFTYFLVFNLVFLLFSCKSTKHVPDGKYLVHKNVITYTDEKLNSDEVALLIRQQPNKSLAGLKLKLAIYNMMDSTKVAKSGAKHYRKIKKINAKKLAKQKRINDKRITKAKSKGKKYYTERIIPLKDTVNLKLTFREWMKFKKGERAVLYDSTLNQKTVDQLKIYLKKKGYYYGDVTSHVVDNKKNPKKRTVHYTIHSGKAYYIDSFYFTCSNETVKNEYQRYIRKQTFNPLLGERFDHDYLNEHRNQVAKALRDRSIYAFSPSSINFIADTNKRDMKLSLNIVISDRVVSKGDTTATVPYSFAYVQDVFFHLIDTSYYKGSFKRDMQSKDLSLNENGFVRTIDTMYYKKIKYTKQDVKRRKKDGIVVTTDMLNPWRFATVYYNTLPTVRPAIIELQNYLEKDNVYKDYYIDRSYNRLMQLDVFQTIKPVVKEIEGTNKLEVHYYLVPAKKQAYNFEPRFSNSNGFLGVSASVNYNNKNLFRGSEKLTISFSGGFESQPQVFNENLDGSSSKDGRSFNTFEIGPSIKIDVPGLMPLKATKLSKRHRPRTVVSTAYNYQKRNDFTRSVFQLNYLWKFYSGKKQVFQFGFPAAAIKFVAINPSDEFRTKLKENNDLFLINAYSDQFVWEDFKLLYEFNNKVEKNGKANHLLNASFTNAGWLLNQFNLKDTTATGQKKVFGVGYSRFIRLEADYIYSYPFSKKLSVHSRVNAGFGMPTGNETTSLPFDYSFFAGGSNDNRGWLARSLGPGSYKYYLDPNRTATQIGDVKLAAYGELRYAISPMIKSAVFIDAGNIWTYKNDINRVGSQFSNDFYKEIALSAGMGLRFDMTFLIIRLDYGFPLTNPALPNGAKWIFQSRQKYYDEGLATFGSDYKSLMPKPFIPHFQFGIGYPF